jgi:hypothetical protein
MSSVCLPARHASAWTTGLILFSFVNWDQCPTNINILAPKMEPLQLSPEIQSGDIPENGCSGFESILLICRGHKDLLNKADYWPSYQDCVNCTVIQHLVTVCIHLYIFFIRIVGSGTESTRHVGHWRAYCICPGWLWWWRIWRNVEWQGRKPAPAPLYPPQIPLARPGLEPGPPGWKAVD